MEYLLYKFLIYISNGIDGIPIFAENEPFQQICKKCILMQLALPLGNDYGITKDWPRSPHDTLFNG